LENQIKKQKFVLLNANESRTHNFKRELLRRGWSVEELSCIGWNKAIRDLVRFLRAIRGAKFVLCGVGFPWQGLWILLAQFLGIKVLIDCPVDVTVKPFPEVWHWKLILGFFFRRADLFLTLSTRDYLVGKFRLNPAKVLFLENCPDLNQIEVGLRSIPRFMPLPDRLVLGYSGVALSQHIDRFVPTFKLLTERFRNLVWLVISEPNNPMILRLCEEARKLNVIESIIVISTIEPFTDFVATIAQCHMWVGHMGNDSLLGIHELRMELLEMGAQGKPVIFVPTPAIEKQGFVNDENIILIDPDRPKESAECISRYLDSQAEQERIGENLRKHVLAKFSLTSSIDRLLDATGC
jgi:glycosyltransferase involved in cell wall biosynthesis